MVLFYGTQDHDGYFPIPPLLLSLIDSTDQPSCGFAAVKLVFVQRSKRTGWLRPVHLRITLAVPFLITTGSGDEMHTRFQSSHHGGVQTFPRMSVSYQL